LVLSEDPLPVLVEEPLSVREVEPEPPFWPVPEPLPEPPFWPVPEPLPEPDVPALPDVSLLPAGDPDVPVEGGVVTFPLLLVVAGGVVAGGVVTWTLTLGAEGGETTIGVEAAGVLALGDAAVFPAVFPAGIAELAVWLLFVETYQIPTPIAMASTKQVIRISPKLELDATSRSAARFSRRTFRSVAICEAVKLAWLAAALAPMA
jgi:hypothetical protein